MGNGRQAEEDEILFLGGGFQFYRRGTRLGMTFPDGELVSAKEKIFHRPTHFPVTEDEHPELIISFHSQDCHMRSC
jgi:hypothetical protein